jgi:peptidoglycan hydrolase-like protein with peptidoglycan-binding domain
MALDERAARAHAIAGFQAAFSREPTLSERQCLQAIGRLETSYGYGWKGAGKGSNNMGAITAGYLWNGDTFEHRDSRPATPNDPLEKVKDGQIWYTTKFRAYPTAAAGWEDLARLVYEKRPAALESASAGDSYAFSAALYATRYYLGRHQAAAENIAAHHKAVLAAIRAMSAALGEVMPGGMSAPMPTLRRGDTGEPVRALQRELGLVADGKFGPHTESAVRAIQAARGLKADGVVGPLTWAALDDDARDTERPPAPGA